MILHKEKYGSIEFNKEIPCLIWKPYHFHKSEQFRSLLLRGVEDYIKYKKDYPVLHWLNDTRKIKVVAKEDQQWLCDVINKNAYEAGLKYMAFVLPENIFGKLAVRIYVQNTLRTNNNSLTIKIFNGYVNAENWLKSHSYQYI